MSTESVQRCKWGVDSLKYDTKSFDKTLKYIFTLPEYLFIYIVVLGAGPEPGGVVLTCAVSPAGRGPVLAVHLGQAQTDMINLFVSTQQS